MKIWTVEVGYKEGTVDPLGSGVKRDIQDLGIAGVEEVKTFNVYFIEGELNERDVRRICEELLADRIIQTYGYSDGELNKLLPKAGVGWLVEVRFKPGVMDAVGMSTENALRLMGIGRVKSVRTGVRYLIIGKLNEEEVREVCKRCLVNELIHDYSLRRVGKDVRSNS